MKRFLQGAITAIILVTGVTALAGLKRYTVTNRLVDQSFVFFEDVAGNPQPVSAASPLPVTSLGGGASSDSIKIASSFQQTCTTTPTALTSAAGLLCQITNEEALGGTEVWFSKGTFTAGNSGDGASLQAKQPMDWDVETNCSEIFCATASGTARISVTVFEAR